MFYLVLCFGLRNTAKREQDGMEKSYIDIIKLRLKHVEESCQFLFGISENLINPLLLLISVLVAFFVQF